MEAFLWSGIFITTGIGSDGFSGLCTALSKYRINPGNVGKGDKRDRQFGQMIEAACGGTRRFASVSTGSPVKASCQPVDANNFRPLPGMRQVMYEALITSAVNRLVVLNMGLDSQIILSCKVSGVQDLISVYRELAPLRLCSIWG